MRDAFGGTFTMNFLLVFIFIYVAFTAVSLNYARAFRVKNSVIDFVEQNEITNLEEYFKNSTVNTTKLDNILNNSSYHKTCDSLNYEEGPFITTKDEEGYCHKGILIVKKEKQGVSGANDNIIYYQITTYADWELGALNKLLALAGRNQDSDSVLSGTWSIHGEAKVVIKN